ncbi:uncharacterized protein [Anabrus simplex]|uniref:uncharacterized protein n=1 Tax=Anabrus simplex TaxID=316456 RepID=UPI0035A3B084
MPQKHTMVADVINQSNVHHTLKFSCVPTDKSLMDSGQEIGQANGLDFDARSTILGRYGPSSQALLAHEQHTEEGEERHVRPTVGLRLRSLTRQVLEVGLDLESIQVNWTLKVECSALSISGRSSSSEKTGRGSGVDKLSIRTRQAPSLWSQVMMRKDFLCTETVAESCIFLYCMDEVKICYGS